MNVPFLIGQGIGWHFLGFILNPVNSAHRDLKVGHACAVVLRGKLSPVVS